MPGTPGGCGAGRRRWARCVAFQPLPLPQPSKATRGPAPLGRLLPRWPLGPQLCTQSQAAHVNEFVAGHAPFVPDECPQQGGGVWEATRSGPPARILARLGAGRALGRLLGEGEPQSQDPEAQQRAAHTPRAPYSWAFSSSARQTGLHEASETTGVLCTSREAEALGGLTGQASLSHGSALQGRWRLPHGAQSLLGEPRWWPSGHLWLRPGAT